MKLGATPALVFFLGALVPAAAEERTDIAQATIAAAVVREASRLATAPETEPHVARFQQATGSATDDEGRTLARDALIGAAIGLAGGLFIQKQTSCCHPVLLGTAVGGSLGAIAGKWGGKTAGGIGAAFAAIISLVVLNGGG
jgi:hypothetical protein